MLLMASKGTKLEFSRIYRASWNWFSFNHQPVTGPITPPFLILKLEECCIHIQGARKLAVNANVSGYCVHLPVCILQTIKSTEKVSCLRKSPYWEELLPSTCLSKLSSSLSRCPLSTKSGVEFYEDRGVSLTTSQPCLSLNPSPQSLTICLVGFLGWEHGQNMPNGRKLPTKRSLPDVFLSILMESDPPTILPCIVHIMRMIFAFYSDLVLTWPRYAVTKSHKWQFFLSILAILVRVMSGLSS